MVNVNAGWDRRQSSHAYSALPGSGNYGEKYTRGDGTEQLHTARLESTLWELGRGKAAKNDGENRLPSVAFGVKKAKLLITKLDLLATSIFQMAEHHHQQ